MMAEPERRAQVGREAVLAQARRGEVVVLDVRPSEEFDAAQLPSRAGCTRRVESV